MKSRSVVNVPSTAVVVVVHVGETVAGVGVMANVALLVALSGMTVVLLVVVMVLVVFTIVVLMQGLRIMYWLQKAEATLASAGFCLILLKHLSVSRC